MEKIDFNRTALEIIYKALFYTARNEKVEFDEKHHAMLDALLYSVPETDVSDIPDVLDKMYEYFLTDEDIQEQLNENKEDEEDEEE